MTYRSPHRPTGAGGIPTDYMRSPTPVCLVNQDGSRRREDTDDTGAQQRRTPAQGANGPDHWWKCWGDENGPGARFRTEVRGELASIKSRITWYNGGVAVLSAIGMIVLAAWLSGKFAANERSAVKREDVAAAVQQSANMAVAKQADDFMLLRKQLEQAAADVALPAAARTRK